MIFLFSNLEPSFKSCFIDSKLKWFKQYIKEGGMVRHFICGVDLNRLFRLLKSIITTNSDISQWQKKKLAKIIQMQEEYHAKKD